MKKIISIKKESYQFITHQDYENIIKEWKEVGRENEINTENDLPTYWEIIGSLRNKYE